jgi:hypothetical protein
MPPRDVWELADPKPELLRDLASRVLRVPAAMVTASRQPCSLASAATAGES